MNYRGLHELNKHLIDIGIEGNIISLNYTYWLIIGKRYRVGYNEGFYSIFINEPHSSDIAVDIKGKFKYPIGEVVNYFNKRS